MTEAMPEKYEDWELELMNYVDKEEKILSDPSAEEVLRYLMDSMNDPHFDGYGIGAVMNGALGAVETYFEGREPMESKYEAIKILGDNHKLIMEKIDTSDLGIEYWERRLSDHEGWYLVYHPVAPRKVHSIQTFTMLNGVFSNMFDITSHRFTKLEYK